jgi:hypothetical protein
LRLFKAGVPRKSDFRFKPDFGFCLALFDMNMNRFVTFVRPKREAVSFDILDCSGHCGLEGLIQDCLMRLNGNPYRVRALIVCSSSIYRWISAA